MKYPALIMSILAIYSFSFKAQDMFTAITEIEKQLGME